jgi:DNA-binding XRE family transcriptional regulator
MASVRITTDTDFPLMRNIDVDHQPSRAEIYRLWSKTFRDDVPGAVDHLADVIEDVFSFRLWEDNYLDGPDAFFERFGIYGLDLDQPAKLLKELRTETGKKKYQIAIRQGKAKALRDEGLTQQAIADELGVSRPTIVSDLVSENGVMTPKTDTHRERVTYQLSQYTKPETAARKIREKFGGEFANELSHALTQKQP